LRQNFDDRVEIDTEYVKSFIRQHNLTPRKLNRELGNYDGKLGRDLRNGTMVKADIYYIADFYGMDALKAMKGRDQ